MQDGDHLDHLSDAIDDDVIGMHHRLARAGHTAGAKDVGSVGQTLDNALEDGREALGGGGLRSAI